MERLLPMQRMSIKNSGFTLVEVAIITPILILVAAGLITALILMANNVSGPNRQNILIRNQHKAISYIESDVVNSTGFLESNFMSDPQIGDYTFNDPNSNDYASAQKMILLKHNLSQNYSNTNETIPSFLNAPYPTSTACKTSTNTDENNTEPLVIIYYTKNESGGGKTLYRRTLTASRINASTDSLGPECATKLAVRSCQQILPPNCIHQDLRITDVGSLRDFNITYYTATDATDAASDPTVAQSILVSLTGGLAGVASDESTYTSTARLSRIGD